MTLPERPPFGTAPIRCGKTRCKWRGFETDLAQVPHPTIRSATQCACPACGCDSYMFMTPREVAAWERARLSNQPPKEQSNG